MAKLEICCFGIECALVAQEYGADRDELKINALMLLFL